MEWIALVARLGDGEPQIVERNLFRYPGQIDPYKRSARRRLKKSGATFVKWIHCTLPG